MANNVNQSPKVLEASVSGNNITLTLSEDVKSYDGQISPNYLKVGTTYYRTRAISSAQINPLNAKQLILTVSGESLTKANEALYVFYNPPETGDNDGTPISDKGCLTNASGAKIGQFGIDNIETYTSATSVTSSQLGSAYRNLMLLGNRDINATGNNQVNTIFGNDANNILDGGKGEDKLIGGKGNDTYIINDDEGDIVVEKLNEGIDTIISSINYTLGENLEVLTLAGSANLSGTGNGLNNVITGNSGNNVIDGRAGADTLIGGKGNDEYYVDSPGDIITEKANEGTDHVISSVSYTLAANLENLTLAGSDALTGVGNSSKNSITGNDGNNILDGGIGADALSGKKGDDLYIVDNIKDIIIENISEGTDTVQSQLNWKLGDNLENLTLTGSANLSGTGNTLNNIITGNSGNNVLDGGLGNDTMIGGKGDDTYYIDSAAASDGTGIFVGDSIIEKPNEGTDTVFVEFRMLYELPENVENLIGRSDYKPSAGTGGKYVGNKSNNILESRGDNDILTGMGGADVFRIATRPRYEVSACPWRYITDFSSAQGDKIQISKSAFGITAATATLSVVSGSSQAETYSGTSLFVYDNSSGELYWNQNGTKSGYGTGGIIAVFDNKPFLSASDISII